MTSAATATLTEAREALAQHWTTILSVSFILLIPLWVGLFLVDVLGFLVLPFVSIGLYAYIKQAVDPNERQQPLRRYIRQHLLVGVMVTTVRLVLLGVLGYIGYQVAVATNLSFPGFEIGGAAVPIVDLQLPWLLLLAVMAMLPVSAAPTAFTSVIAVSQGFGPREAFKQNYRLWRRAPLRISAYLVFRFILLAGFIGGIVALWLALNSLVIAVLTAVLLAPVLFTLISTYHYYYYTDIVMVV